MTNFSPSSKSGIARASACAGGQAALAKKLNAAAGSGTHVSQQAVSEWVCRGYAPSNRALAISQCIKHYILPIDLIDPKLRQILECVAKESKS